MENPFVPGEKGAIAQGEIGGCGFDQQSLYRNRDTFTIKRQGISFQFDQCGSMPSPDCSLQTVARHDGRGVLANSSYSQWSTVNSWKPRKAQALKKKAMWWTLSLMGATVGKRLPCREELTSNARGGVISLRFGFPGARF